MKQNGSVIFAIISCLFMSACGKEETKFEAFNAEAFAYYLGDGWEVNAAVQVKGFEQIHQEDMNSAKLSYSVDLITPDGNTIKALFVRTEEKLKEEKMLDAPLEAQIELDSTYSEGMYKLIFNIMDEISGRTAKSSAAFELKLD